jgi:hypothetical protein
MMKKAVLGLYEYNWPGKTLISRHEWHLICIQRLHLISASCRKIELNQAPLIFWRGDSMYVYSCGAIQLNRWFPTQLQKAAHCEVELPNGYLFIFFWLAYIHRVNPPSMSWNWRSKTRCLIYATVKGVWELIMVTYTPSPGPYMICSPTPNWIYLCAYKSLIGCDHILEASFQPFHSTCPSCYMCLNSCCDLLLQCPPKK